MPEGDQPLLGAVVEVALEPAAFLVAGMQQPGPAGLDLAERLPQLDPQPDDLDEQRARVGQLREQLLGGDACRRR